MDLTAIVIVLGVIFMITGVVINVQRSKNQKSPNFPAWGLAVLGFFFLLMPKVFLSIILGTIDGFIELPNTITMPNLELSVSPVWVVALIIGLIAGVLGVIQIRKNAKAHNMSYGEYIMQAKQDTQTPTTTDQTPTQQTSSDQSQNQ